MSTPLLTGNTGKVNPYNTTGNEAPTAVQATRDHIQRKCVYLSAQGLRAASGISSNYDNIFPVELNGVIEETRFKNDIQQINHALADYWPCPTCFIGGYLCIPCTLGLSLLCPNICVSGAEKFVKHLIQDQINQRREYVERHVTWSLHRSCGGGYIQIEYDVIVS
jgi:hypothetical protein